MVIRNATVVMAPARSPSDSAANAPKTVTRIMAPPANRTELRSDEEA